MNEHDDDLDAEISMALRESEVPSLPKHIAARRHAIYRAGLIAGMRRAAEIVGHPANTFRICTLVAPDILAAADKLELEQEQR